MSEQQAFVVVGCDGTPASDAALRFAAAEAELHGARLLLVTAFDRPIDPDSDDFDIPDEVLRRQARDGASASLNRALIKAERVPDHEIVAVEGEPAKVLLEHGDGALMIVIGSHDRSMVQRLFGRPTGRELQHHTVVPLVIVPTPSG